MSEAFVPTLFQDLLWFPGGDVNAAPKYGKVHTLASDSPPTVDMTVIPLHGEAFMPKNGVRHVSDPGFKINEAQRKKGGFDSIENHNKRMHEAKLREAAQIQKAIDDKRRQEEEDEKILTPKADEILIEMYLENPSHPFERYSQRINSELHRSKFHVKWVEDRLAKLLKEGRLKKRQLAGAK